MNTTLALLVVSCVVSSMLYAAEVDSAAEDYIWQERFNARLEQARKGNAEAQFNVGEMYEKGSGVPSSMKSAFTWFELAAKQDHQKAQYKIAYMYFRGEGVTANPGKAFQLMTPLAKNGYGRAQYHLALMYETGVATTRNLDQARLWYRRAAQSGYTPAEEALADRTRFPAERAPIEAARVTPARPQPANIPSIPSAKAPAPVAAPLVQNTLPKNPNPPNPPVANNESIATALINEAARGAQVALGLGAATSRLDLPTPPLTTVAGLQPVFHMQPTMYSALTNGNWVSQTNLPVEYLPSELTSCAPNNERAIMCVSKELVRTVGDAEIGYKTQATLFAVQPSGEFKITYRNNIVKINRRGESKAAKEPAGADKSIKLGLQETEHRLECKLENEWTIQCVKNQTQKIMMTNQNAQQN